MGNQICRRSDNRIVDRLAKIGRPIFTVFRMYLPPQVYQIYLQEMRNLPDHDDPYNNEEGPSWVNQDDEDINPKYPKVHRRQKKKVADKANELRFRLIDLSWA